MQILLQGGDVPGKRLIVKLLVNAETGLTLKECMINLGDDNVAMDYWIFKTCGSQSHTWKL